VVQALARHRLQRTITIENLIKTLDELTATRNAQAVPRADLAAELRMEPRSFDRTLRRAAAQGFVQIDDGAVRLTGPGRARSARIGRAHTLWEEYLQQKVGVAPDHVHDAAEWIEHHLSDEAVREIDQTLERTSTSTSA
jgi:Mn-dependent DtxR family transcriptional regulator